MNIIKGSMLVKKITPSSLHNFLSMAQNCQIRGLVGLSLLVRYLLVVMDCRTTMLIGDMDIT